jgi:AcrR family transcriptional regulator
MQLRYHSGVALPYDNEGRFFVTVDEPEVSRRRRGVELEDAICLAAFAELGDVGFGALTIESVAARAQTGKASIYRRWATKNELLMDAFCRGMPTPAGCLMAAEVDDAVDTRDALHTVVGMMIDGIAGANSATIHEIASEAIRDPAFGQAVDREMLAPRRQGLVELFRRGIERGEVDADAPVDLVAEMIPSMVMMHVLFKHESPGPELVTQLVDTLAMPLLRGSSND